MRRTLAQSILATTLYAGIGLFCPLLATANPQCESVFLAIKLSEVQITIEPAVVGVLPVEAYKERIQEIHALLGNLEPATDSKITIGRHFMFSVFDEGTKEVYVGIRPESMGPKNPSVNLTTLSHEYGHAVFEKNLLKDLESYKLLKEQMQEAESLREKIEISSQDPQESTAETRFLKKKLRALKSRLVVREALHELFADAVTLAVTKDPQAIEKVLRDANQTYAPHSYAEISLRDMSGGENQKNIEAWNKEFPIHAKYKRDIYYALMPARWELWSTSKSKLSNEAYRKIFLTKVFEILERNLSENLTRPARQLGIRGLKDIANLNRQIIADFRREL